MYTICTPHFLHIQKEINQTIYSNVAYTPGICAYSDRVVDNNGGKRMLALDVQRFKKGWLSKMFPSKISSWHCRRNLQLYSQSMSVNKVRTRLVINPDIFQCAEKCVIVIVSSELGGHWPSPCAWPQSIRSLGVKWSPWGPVITLRTAWDQSRPQTSVMTHYCAYVKYTAQDPLRNSAVAERFFDANFVTFILRRNPLCRPFRRGIPLSPPHFLFSNK